MRILFKNLLVVLFGVSSFANVNAQDIDPAMVATIEDGRFDVESQEIVLDVKYGGGCREHKFILDYKGCSEDKLSCSANLIQVSGFDDRCKAIKFEEVRFAVDPQYSVANELRVFGAGYSKAVIALHEEQIDENPAIVLEGWHNQKEDQVILDVSYSGGCMEHKFALNFEECANGICIARLKRVSGFGDHCKRLVQESVVVPVDRERLINNDGLKIIGGNDSSIYVEIFQ